MREVVIIGVGTTAFGNFPERTYHSIAAEACQKALRDANITSRQVEAFYLGNYAGESLALQGASAAFIGRGIGLGQIPCTKVEGACTSGSLAFRLGFLQVATGLAEIVLVAGVEKMSGASREILDAALWSALDRQRDAITGLTFPGYFGLVMRRHMYEYRTTRRQLALLSVKNRQNGSRNPICLYQSEVSVEEVLGSRIIAAPFLLYDSCNRADGGAAAILCSAERARAFHPGPIRILASVQATGRPSLSDAEDLTAFAATVKAAGEAYEMAGLGPKEINVAEVHDCTTITEIVDSEDLGFFEKGDGGPAVERGDTQLGGRIPINPSGGLLSRGHPFGATGMAQIYEIVQQLRGSAVNQVPKARIGLTHNLGGTGAVATIHIFAS